MFFQKKLKRVMTNHKQAEERFAKEREELPLEKNDRLAMILAAAFMGLYGILIASYVLFGRLSAVDCLGIPYLAPVAPWRPHNPDLVARLPIWLQNRLNFYAEGNSWLKKEQK